MNNINSNNGNMMDMLKTNLMTMTMMNSVNGNSNKDNNGNSNNGLYGLIYIFIITGLIDLFCKTIVPNAIVIIKEYYNEKIKSSKLINIIDSNKNTTKSASITIEINTSDHDNLIGQALLDYITNNKNTKHISYEKRNFSLNQSDIIEISEDFFIKLVENKTMFQKKDDKDDTKQIIEFFSYTKTMKELRSFLDKISHEYTIKIENKLGDKIYYFNQVPMNAPKNGTEKDFSKLPANCIFLMKPFQTNRKFTNLFGPEISIVRKRVEFFMNNKKWYDSKGIPYTLGLLLSGQAGAGKTSTIKCLANETKRHIININLNNDITKTQLENLFFNETILIINISTGTTEKYYIPLDQRIYVLEDIDCQGDLVLERKLKTANENNTNNTNIPKEMSLESIKTNPNKPDMYDNKNTSNITQPEKIDLSFLLNLLDGILEIPGRIIIMTSNYPKMLDHALIRPGRIDIIADFKKCNYNTMIEMIEFFYDIKLNESEKNIIYNTQNEFYSPAEMGKIMFENFGNYKNVISILENNKNIIINSEPTIVQIKETPIVQIKETPIVQIKETPIVQIKETPIYEIINETSIKEIPIDNSDEVTPIQEFKETPIKDTLIGQNKATPIVQNKENPIVFKKLYEYQIKDTPIEEIDDFYYLQYSNFKKKTILPEDVAAFSKNNIFLSNYEPTNN